MRKRLGMLGALLLVMSVLGCDSGLTSNDTIPTADARIDARYAIAGCSFGGSKPTGPPPCTTYSAASGYDRVDSGGVTLSLDGSALWERWVTEVRNPCYNTGNNCGDQVTHSYAHVPGTYYTTDSAFAVIVQIGTAQLDTLWLRMTVRSRVPRDWTGPDSLAYLEFWQGWTTYFTR